APDDEPEAHEHVVGRLERGEGQVNRVVELQALDVEVDRRAVGGREKRRCRPIFQPIQGEAATGRTAVASGEDGARHGGYLRLGQSDGARGVEGAGRFRPPRQRAGPGLTLSYAVAARSSAPRRFFAARVATRPTATRRG